MAARQTWVYPVDGGEPYIKGDRSDTSLSPLAGPAFLPDLPDFKSPVDGKVYSGRAGMREHNVRNDVVPVEDLKGLPWYTTSSDVRSASERRAHEQRRKELIINEVNKHVR